MFYSHWENLRAISLQQGNVQIDKSTKIFKLEQLPQFQIGLKWNYPALRCVIEQGNTISFSNFEYITGFYFSKSFRMRQIK